ncbi:Na+/H+ antiporter NhaC family protein [Oscillatoria sp. FACHB-1407]|uniref:Na+/H+ antiporter NhaC family protein n=1 Tax=Oscillatoria sp. FACHB-1407 TaxID=2692847 RepID=UPI0016876770|nr:Na+/H+ antiporter NhaC family protein [Oscillatoria sp. FACHB-1407]MBD2459843.1 Na+/H+ antiporter NhaC family protein [Oscillatoria sp. FACHB-1407]
MDLIFALTLSFTLLLTSVFRGYFIAYPLFASMLIFMAVLMRRGFSLKSLLKMAFQGSQKSFSVLNVLLLIGVVTAIWMAAGTVPAIVYYGIQLIHPQYFIVATFILCGFVSLLLGTSFGTVSTVGIALMIMAKGSGINPHLVAGAIIAGAYVGDRCSPMSSSANLIATVTQTKLYTNIQNMWRTALVPLVVSALIYALLSLLNPVQITDQTFTTELSRVFKIHGIDLLPAIAILVLAILQIEVRLSMVISVVVAGAIALFYQHYPLIDLLKFAVVGFGLEDSTPLQTILLGGGLLSMVKVSIVVVISTAFVGIFAGTQALKSIERFLERSRGGDRFLSTCLVGIGTAAFGCTQTIAILLTQQLVQKKYKENEKGHYKLALDLENTVVVLAPLIPWNIAGLVPATILNTDAGFIPFAIYLYLLPLLNLIHIRLSTPPKLSLCN